MRVGDIVFFLGMVVRDVCKVESGFYWILNLLLFDFGFLIFKNEKNLRFVILDI